MALCLSRTTGQRIHLGPNITIEVAEIRGGKVRLAIDAPQSVQILRGELHDEMERAADVERRRQQTALANVGLAERVRRLPSRVA